MSTDHLKRRAVGISGVEDPACAAMMESVVPASATCHAVWSAMWSFAVRRCWGSPEMVFQGPSPRSYFELGGLGQAPHRDSLAKLAPMLNFSS